MKTPRLRLVAPAVQDPERLTWVEVRTDRLKLDLRIRRASSVPFGLPLDQRVIGRRHRLLGFGSGAVFADLRRIEAAASAALGRLDILQVAPARDRVAAPGVTPGAARLHRAPVWSLTCNVFATFDALEAAGYPLRDIEPDYWRRLAAGLAEGRSARPYDATRHAAWLARRAARP
jgi:hypothetical protein